MGELLEFDRQFDAAFVQERDVEAGDTVETPADIGYRLDEARLFGTDGLKAFS